LTACYLDASALVKLLAREAETTALRTHIEGIDVRSTSRLSTIEVPRAVMRKGPASLAAVAGPWADILQRLLIIELDAEIAESASEMAPAGLRSLDAIHLASALSIGDELNVLITYDSRLADAARAAGLNVEAPA
jgi:predicted nucleic acid-binding protein